MLSKAVHSVVDIRSPLLLLYGMRRADLRADAGHPIGYGRELYFWSFTVALLRLRARRGGIGLLRFSARLGTRADTRCNRQLGHVGVGLRIRVRLIADRLQAL